MVASAAEGDLGRNQKQDEPKKKRGRPPKQQLKQPSKKGPPAMQKRRGRPSKSETKQANIERYFQDKPANCNKSCRLHNDSPDGFLKKIVTIFQLSKEGASMKMPLRKHKTQARGEVLYLGKILSGILLIRESRRADVYSGYSKRTRQPR